MMTEMKVSAITSCASGSFDLYILIFLFSSKYQMEMDKERRLKKEEGIDRCFDEGNSAG
jgi:hypothetical protein